jgi:hypothetical protein
MYRFKTKMIDADHVEVTITLPSPTPHSEIDVEEQEARKETARWVIAATLGMAKVVGVDITEPLADVYADVSFALDREVILKAIRTRRCTPESLQANPPGGLDPDVVPIVLEYLFDTHAIYLDGHLKCSGDN